jgi:hypothetical protein
VAFDVSISEGCHLNMYAFREDMSFPEGSEQRGVSREAQELAVISFHPGAVGNLMPPELLRLQRTAGNRAVAELLGATGKARTVSGIGSASERPPPSSAKTESRVPTQQRFEALVSGQAPAVMRVPAALQRCGPVRCDCESHDSSVLQRSSYEPRDAGLPGGVDTPPQETAEPNASMPPQPCDPTTQSCPPGTTDQSTAEPNASYPEDEPNQSYARPWKCDAQCNVEGTEPQCTGRVYGSGEGPSEEAACRNAKRDATQKAPRGCYARHCKCDCTQ